MADRQSELASIGAKAKIMMKLFTDTWTSV